MHYTLYSRVPDPRDRRRRVVNDNVILQAHVRRQVAHVAHTSPVTDRSMCDIPLPRYLLVPYLENGLEPHGSEQTGTQRSISSVCRSRSDALGLSGWREKVPARFELLSRRRDHLRVATSTRRLEPKAALGRGARSHPRPTQPFPSIGRRQNHRTMSCSRGAENDQMRVPEESRKERAK